MKNSAKPMLGFRIVSLAAVQAKKAVLDTGFDVRAAYIRFLFPPHGSGQSIPHSRSMATVAAAIGHSCLYSVCSEATLRGIVVERDLDGSDHAVGSVCHTEFAVLSIALTYAIAAIKTS
jgi:hypothetical protein